MKTKPIPEVPNKSTDAPPMTPEDVLASLRSQLSAAQAHARQSIEKSISEVRQSIDASKALMGSGERFLRESLARDDQNPDPNQKKVEDAFRRSEAAVAQSLQLFQNPVMPEPAHAPAAGADGSKPEMP